MYMIFVITSMDMSHCMVVSLGVYTQTSHHTMTHILHHIHPQLHTRPTTGVVRLLVCIVLMLYTGEELLYNVI